MKKIYKIIILLLICVGQTGCFIFAPSNSSTPQNTTPTASQTAQMLAQNWNGLQVYRVADGKLYSSQSSSGWMRFNANGTCYEKGYLGTNGNQQLRWSVSGRKLTISGGDFTFGDGNLSDTKITYDIVSVTASELHLSRPDGHKFNGSGITRHLILTR